MWVEKEDEGGVDREGLSHAGRGFYNVFNTNITLADSQNTTRAFDTQGKRGLKLDVLHTALEQNM